MTPGPDLTTQEIAQIASAIRRAVITDGPWLLRRPGHRLWGILLSPTAGAAFLYLPGLLAYLAIRRSQVLRVLRPGASIPYGRLAAMLALELPIIGEQGKRLHSVALRNGNTDELLADCCLIRTVDLPWLHNDMLPGIDAGNDQTSSGAWTVPDLADMDLATANGLPAWPPPDIGAKPFADAAAFYRSLLLPDRQTVPDDLRQNFYASLLLRHRNAERTRCALLGYAVPAWLTDDGSIDADVAALLGR